MKKEKTTKITNKKLIFVLEIFCICLFVAGSIVFFYPLLRSISDARRANELTTAYDQKITELDDESDTMILPELWDTMQNYNVRLATTGQDKMRDIFSYESFAVDISEYDFPDNIFGYIEIPKFNRKYPLYLGSSRSNMAKGATVLGESSAPIGGENTHCVIAAHNYWQGADVFRKIHTLSVGELVIVTNPWESLTYRVIGHKQIKPYEFDDLFIKDGKDLLTLFTCYPNGKSRWCVFCERVK